MEKYESYNDSDLESFNKIYGGLELEQYYNDMEDDKNETNR